MVEGARLESVFRGNSNVGSNPTLSASLKSNNLLDSSRPKITKLGRHRLNGAIRFPGHLTCLPNRLTPCYPQTVRSEPEVLNMKINILSILLGTRRLSTISQY